MSPEIQAQYMADLARNRHERNAYRKRASFHWKEYIRLRKERRFLDALNALTRHREYREHAAYYENEISLVKAHYGKGGR